jgi:hypothetical protein
VFAGTNNLLFFDQLRVPYMTVAPDEAWGGVAERSPLRSLARFQTENGSGPRFIAWPSAWNGSSPTREFHLDDVPLYGRLLDDATAERWLRSEDTGWHRTTTIRDAGGRAVAAVWRDRSGNAFLPFEPDEVILSFLTESYKDVLRTPLDAVGAKATRLYYRAKRAVPREAQIRFRRALSVVQQKTRFPRWPVEPALIEFSRRLFLLFEDVACTQIPWIAPWPNGSAWALVLTHDVETRLGYEHLHVMRAIELAANRRSSWNFVPSRYEPRTRYEVTDTVVDALVGTGFEVGVHGLKHDGRDVASLQMLAERGPKMREYAARWNAVGFRSPATHRDWNLMPMLGFEYDSSYTDTDPFEPQRGGCCSWLPYFNRGLVELPITLPQDHTLFTILGHTDETAWVHKTETIRRQGGMALMLTHPDYMIDPDRAAAYARYLDTFAHDANVWHALPREVSAWWRSRAASMVVRSRKGWVVDGPAAGAATLSFAAPSGVQ